MAPLIRDCCASASVTAPFVRPLLLLIKLEPIAASYSKLAALPNAVSTAVVVVLEVFISAPMKEKGLTPTNQPCFLACPDSWAFKFVVKVNNAKKSSKAVVVIFAMVVFFMAVFFMVVIFFIVFSMVVFFMESSEISRQSG